MPSIVILNFIEDNGAVYYNINTRLPLRSVIALRRFSEFLKLTQDLSKELGMAPSEFPYRLPSKGGVLSNKQKLASSRIKPLEIYLNKIIQDRDLQNRTNVHEFLQLPRSYKFTPEASVRNPEDGDYNGDTLINLRSEDITKKNWLSIVRMGRSVLNRIENKDLPSTVAERRRIKKCVLSAINLLEFSLTKQYKEGEIIQSEFKERTTTLSLLKEEAAANTGSYSGSTKDEAASTWSRHLNANDQPKETMHTITFSNKELVQKQQQEHKDQDLELEELRKAIANQKKIGEAINREVTEQNEFLDALSSEVEASNGKLDNARARTRKIG